MTIADMSVITAEVKVDETDIVNVQLGQPAEVTIDAIPKKIFHGNVTEIGDNAIVRSSGVSTSQQTTASEEAKDFKVVVTLSDAPEDLRPGLSTTAKITTATRSNALSVPIQALTLRTQGSDRRSKIIRRDRCTPRHRSKEVASKTKKATTAGRFRDPQQESDLRSGRDRHHRNHRYRSARWFERRATR